MRALDTNVLVRFLVRDDRKQASAVYREFKHAEDTKEVFFIPVLVVLETIWVLESVYQVSRNDILNSFEELLLMPILEFEAQFMVRKFLSSAHRLPKRPGPERKPKIPSHRPPHWSPRPPLGLLLFHPLIWRGLEQR